MYAKKTINIGFIDIVILYVLIKETITFCKTRTQFIRSITLVIVIK